MQRPAPAATDALRPARGRATIADVARQAGVSKATVSRFLNRRDELLTADIAARVAQAIEALAYQPSAMARSLKHGRTRLIGLVVADITNPFSVAVLRGAEQACQQAGYLIVLFNLGNEPGREHAAMQALAAYQVDGLILNRVAPGAQTWRSGALHGKPVVLVDRRHDDLQADFVSIDNRQAVALALRHLVDAGYRRFLLVTEPFDNVSSRIDRARAFEDWLQQAELPGELVESTEVSQPALLARLRQQQPGPQPLAVLSGNAVATLRVATAMAELGWHFGQELGFVGIDETDWSALIDQGLSTVAQPTDALGALAVRCLLERLEGLETPARNIELPGRLIERASSNRRHHPDLTG